MYSIISNLESIIGIPPEARLQRAGYKPAHLDIFEDLGTFAVKHKIKLNFNLQSFQQCLPIPKDAYKSRSYFANQSKKRISASRAREVKYFYSPKSYILSESANKQFSFQRLMMKNYLAEVKRQSAIERLAFTTGTVVEQIQIINEIFRNTGINPLQNDQRILCRPAEIDFREYCSLGFDGVDFTIAALSEHGPLPAVAPLIRVLQ